MREGWGVVALRWSDCRTKGYRLNRNCGFEANASEEIDLSHWAIREERGRMDGRAREWIDQGKGADGGGREEWRKRDVVRQRRNVVEREGQDGWAIELGARREVTSEASDEGEVGVAIPEDAKEALVERIQRARHWGCAGCGRRTGRRRGARGGSYRAGSESSCAARVGGRPVP